MPNTQGKPTYSADNCPECKEWEKEDALTMKNRAKLLCMDCRGEIKSAETMNSGYKSFTVRHWHFKGLGSSDGLQVRFARLCHDCMLKDWEVLYPGKSYKEFGGAAEDLGY